jgi:general secretion pathway protein G
MLCQNIPVMKTSTKTLKKAAQKGLTLVEIIVVLVILSILIAFLTGGLFKQGERAKAQINALKMEKTKAAIGQYQLMYNQLPPDLRSLVSCPDSSRACVPITDEDTITDGWGTPYVYSLDNGGRSFTLKSLGADKRDGGSGAEGDMTITGP